MKEERAMFGTQKKWGYKIPKTDYNSLVSEDGRVVKNDWADENEVLADWNYDEPMDLEDLEEDIPEFDPEAAKKAREEANQSPDEQA